MSLQDTSSPGMACSRSYRSLRTLGSSPGIRPPFPGAFLRGKPARHLHRTGPKYLKVNAFNERFNRTVQEELIGHEEDLRPDDLWQFNERLMGYLERYNGRRPHQGLGYLTPCQVLARYWPNLSHRWWPRTLTTSPIVSDGEISESSCMNRWIGRREKIMKCSLAR